MSRTRLSVSVSGPVIAIFLWSLFLRLVYLRQIASNPFFDAPGVVLAYSGPLYPHFLGLVARLFGGGYFAPRLAQAALGAVAAALVGVIARRLYGPGAGLIAGLIAGSAAMLIYFDSEILPVVFENLAILLFLWLALVAADRPHPLAWLPAGLALGLVVALRPPLVAFAAVSLLWVVWSAGLRPVRPGRLAAVVAAVGVSAALVIVTAHAARSLYPAGLDDYFGNHAGADGVSATAPGFTGNPPGGYGDAVRLASKAAEVTLTPRGADHYWEGEARRFAAEHPAEHHALLIRKALVFWNPYEYGNHQLVPFFRRYAPLLRLGLPGFGFIAPLGLAGLLFTTRNRNRLLPALFVVLFFLATAPALVSDRTRIAIVPVLIILAGGFVTWLFGAIGREPRVALLAVIATAGLFIGIHQDLAGIPHPGLASSHAELADRLLHLGRTSEAERELRAVLSQEPDYPHIHLKLAELMSRDGRLAGAIDEYRAEIAARGEDPDLLLRLASLLQATGAYDDAAICYRRSLAIRPNDVPAMYGLALCQLQHGDLPAADVTLAGVLRLDPTNLPALNNLGVVAAREGRYDVAIATWRKVLAIDPGFQRARENIESATRGRHERPGE